MSMSKKLCTLLAIFILTIASSITAFAAPEVMPDGGVFDAEYYAQNNPDVAAAFGMDKELLYSHYVNCGKAEGRLAVAPVELTKENPVTLTAKREQLRDEYYSWPKDDRNIYYDTESVVKVKDKTGRYFKANEIDCYFSDVVIEQFNNYGELVAFVKSVDLYKYAEENTWANYYYYQELKAIITDAAYAHVNDGYFQYHYWTKERVMGNVEVCTCMANLGITLEPYYGSDLCWMSASGMHITAYRGIFDFDADGYCVRLGMYKNTELRNKYFDNWYSTEACKSGLK